jgi:hypothetical protein
MQVMCSKRSEKYEKSDINTIKNEKSPPRRRTASLGISPSGEPLFMCWFSYTQIKITAILFCNIAVIEWLS